MPRIARLVVKGEPAVYHVVSRTALDGFVLRDVETPVKSASLVFREEFNGAKEPQPVRTSITELSTSSIEFTKILAKAGNLRSKNSN